MEQAEFLARQYDLLTRRLDDPTIEWQDIADLRIEYTGEVEHRDTIRKGAKLFYEFLKGGWIHDPTQVMNATNNKAQDVPSSSNSETVLQQLKKERYKIQTEKLELNRWLRENARDELIVEHICQAIERITPLSIPEPIIAYHGDREYLCCFGDCHYGVEFELRDLFGDIINSYSPEIFKSRMINMLEQIIEIVRERGITELNLWDLGDSIQGILRLDSQLMKLRYGIVDSSIQYADFISQWINTLSQYVRIKFQMVIDSNHNQLRICNAPKNAFKEENMSKVILSFVKERLKYNQNVEVIENPTGMNYGELAGFRILGIHGEVKNLSESLNKFSMTYKHPLDYIIGAHCHHFINTETGRRSESIQIRSVIGVDPYGLSLNKTSDAGASLLVFENGKGLSCEYKLILN